MTRHLVALKLYKSFMAVLVSIFGLDEEALATPVLPSRQNDGRESRHF
jgi:hypothetical protein